MTTEALKRLIEARDVLREWAGRHIIVEECIPQDNRMQGCFSCETLAFFEALDEDIAEQRAMLSKADQV